MTIVNVLIKWSLRGAKRRACALKRYDAQAWQSLRLLPCLPAGRASLAMTIYDVASTFSILTAQTLNSGIFAMGSKAGLVNMFKNMLKNLTRYVLLVALYVTKICEKNRTSIRNPFNLLLWKLFKWFSKDKGA